MSSANRLTHKAAALAHFAIADAVIAAADSSQHRTFEKALHIYHQVKMLAVQQRAHFAKIFQLITEAQLIKFYLIKIKHLVNHRRIRYKSGKLRMYQPGDFGLGITLAQRCRKGQSVQDITQRTHFD